MKPQHGAAGSMFKRNVRLAVVAAFVAAEVTSFRAKAANTEQSNREPFVVYGLVTDAGGNPFPGVEVWAACGSGTLLRTGSTMSGADGSYRLIFHPGMRMSSGDRVDGQHVGFQAATISARKEGFYIEGLGRAGNLAMTDTTNTAPAWATNFAGVVRAFEPFHLDFKVLRAATVQVRFNDAGHGVPAGTKICLTGEKLPPSSSVLGCEVASDRTDATFKNVPVGFAWWFEASWRTGEGWKTMRSKPFQVQTAGETNVVVSAEADALVVSSR